MDPSIKSKETRLISLSVLKAAQKSVLGYLSIKQAAWPHTTFCVITFEPN